MVIVCCMGYGKKIIVGDLNLESVEVVCCILNEVGFDVVFVEMNFFLREFILNLIVVVWEYGEILMFVNVVGVLLS